MSSSFAAESSKSSFKESITSLNPGYFRMRSERLVLFASIFFLLILFFLLLHISIYAVLASIALSVIIVKIRQGQCLGSAVKVSEDQFPKVYKAIQTVSKRLSMEMPDVFIRQDPVINAFALGLFGKKCVVLNSKTVEVLNDLELTAILGHEFSHIKCGHTAWIVLTSSSKEIKIPIISDILNFIFLFWSRTAEKTADRGSLLSCRNLKASISSLGKVSVGEKLFNDLNILRFIDQKTEIDDNIIAKMAQLFSTHPYMIKRLYALKDYPKTVEFKIATGQQSPKIPAKNPNPIILKLKHKLDNFIRKAFFPLTLHKNFWLNIDRFLLSQSHNRVIMLLYLAWFLSAVVGQFMITKIIRDYYGVVLSGAFVGFIGGFSLGIILRFKNPAFKYEYALFFSLMWGTIIAIGSHEQLNEIARSIISIAFTGEFGNIRIMIKTFLLILLGGLLTALTVSSVDDRFSIIRIITTTVGWGIGWLLAKEVGLSIYEIFKEINVIFALNLYFLISQTMLGIIGICIMSDEYNEIC